MIVEKNNIVINKRKGLLLLVIALLCSTSMYAQDITIQKPTKRTPTQTAPATKSSSTTNKSSNKSSVTKNSSESSTSKPITGYINGHEWADLGLSVKWATCNVGANSPSDYGNYYAWGETKIKSEYTMENGSTYSRNMSDIAGSGTFDAARVNWGGTWRLPTASEIDELVNKCTRIWITQGGHNGYKITGPNGNSIFLPAAGYYDGTTLNVVNVDGLYWSGTSYYGDARGCSYDLIFDDEKLFRDWVVRIYGLAVRPVSE